MGGTPNALLLQSYRDAFLKERDNGMYLVGSDVTHPGLENIEFVKVLMTIGDIL